MAASSAPLVALAMLLLLAAPAQSFRNRKVLFSYSPRAGQTFDPLSNPNFEYRFLDPAQVQVRYSTSASGLTCAATPFTRTENQTGGAGTLDHVKFVIFNKKAFAPTRTRRVLRLTIVQSTLVSNASAHPFPGKYVTHPDDDIRLGSCGLISGDFSNGVVADFFVTNKGIYAYYERLPFYRTASNGYRAFAQVKRSLRNASPNKTSILMVVYDSRRGVLTWMVDWRPVLKVKRIGIPVTDPSVVTILDQGGVDTLVPSLSFSLGWGCFTLLDTVDYWNRNSSAGLVKLNPGGYVTPTSFYDNSSLLQNRLWGQGATITIKTFRVDVGN